MQTMIGVIGGSGVYQIDGLEGASWVSVKTPWGRPSDDILVGRLDGVRLGDRLDCRGHSDRWPVGLQRIPCRCAGGVQKGSGHRWWSCALRVAESALATG